MSMKLDNFLRVFRGNGDDWEQFFEKFLVLASIQGWDTETKRMKSLPLFLDGDAFLVYSRLSATDRKVQGTVVSKMHESFCITKAQAYKCFTQRQLKVDEAVDAYIADLQRLAGQAGRDASDDKDPMVVEQIVCGLRAEFQRELRLAMAGKEYSVSGCTDLIRALRTAATDARQSVQQPVAAAMPASSAQSSGTSTGNGVCFNCQEVGHIRRNCPRLQRGAPLSGGGPRSGGRQKGATQLSCYFCDGVGHVKADCPERKTWLARKRGAAAAGEDAAAQSSHNDPCLCTVAARSRGALPRVYMDIQPADGPGQEWARAMVVVDTRASHSLVSAKFLQACNIPSSDDVSVGMVALDGSEIDLIGTVNLDVQRQDGPVFLPCVSVVACVTRSLEVVGTDVLIGADIVAGVGGVQLSYDDNGVLDGVRFGQAKEPAVVAAAADKHPSRRVTVEQDGDDVTLSTDDGQVRWDSVAQRWMLTWAWKDQQPTAPVGSGIGQYARNKLTAEQESLFCDEVDSWVKNGWLVEHDPAVHGEPVAMLPLLAKAQEHKSSTPVRPCLDYRGLNSLIKSNPGTDAPAYAEKIRKWRSSCDADYQLVDIRKAYLQVHCCAIKSSCGTGRCM